MSDYKKLSKFPNSNQAEAHETPETLGDPGVDPGFVAGSKKGFRSDLSVPKGPGQKVGGSS